MPTSNQGRTYGTHCGSNTPHYRTGPTAPMLPIRRCHRSLRLGTDARPSEAPNGPEEADQASLHGVAPPSHPTTPP